jgi:hypothetical protein
MDDANDQELGHNYSSFIQQLQAEFGDALLKKDNKEPDINRKVPALLCRTFSVLKQGDKAHRATKETCVILSLQKFLRRASVKQLITRDEFIDSVKLASDYITKLRVAASLFANWIFIKKLEAGDPLPDPSTAFYTACLQRLVAGSVPSDKATVDVTTLFQEFSAVTGIAPVQDCPCRLTQVIVFQATEMSTSATNFIKMHYLSRLQCLIRWALKKKLQLRVVMNQDVLNRRINSLVEFLTTTTISENDVIDSIHNKLLELELDEYTIDVEVICAEAWYGNILAASTYSQKLQCLLELQQKYLHVDRRQYLSFDQQAWVQFPNKECKEQSSKRQQYMKQHWKYDTPPKEMSPLPKCKDGAAFIRMDQTAVVEMFPELKNYCKGAWWFSAFADPFSTTANIPVLKSQRNRWARSGEGVLEALRRAKQKTADFSCFTLVNNSFVSDGVSCSLSLITSCHEHEPNPGVPELYKAGYEVSFKVQQLTDLLKRGNGVYKLKHVRSTVEQLKKVHCVGLDPGQIHALDAVVALGSEWTRENVPNLVSKEAIIYTGKMYKDKSGMQLSETMEVKRRHNSLYGAALDALTLERRKTCIPAEFEKYCRAWASVQKDICCELLSEERRIFRFIRYRAVQRTIEEMAATVAPPNMRHEQKRVIFFGKGYGKAAKGHVSTPCKKLVRVMACNCVVIITPEHYTSMMCPGCCRTTSTGEGYRTR